MKIESFIYGKDEEPKWFKEECDKGTIKEKIDEEDERYCVINAATKTYVASIGDEIIKTKHGLSVKSNIDELPSDEKVEG